MQADPPDIAKIPVQDAIGVTVVLLTCGYRSQEFIRVGYYVNNEYADPELKENPPPNPDFDKVRSFPMFVFVYVNSCRIPLPHSPPPTECP